MSRMNMLTGYFKGNRFRFYYNYNLRKIAYTISDFFLFVR